MSGTGRDCQSLGLFLALIDQSEMLNSPNGEAGRLVGMQGGGFVQGGVGGCRAL